MISVLDFRAKAKSQLANSIAIGQKWHPKYKALMPRQSGDLKLK